MRCLQLFFLREPVKDLRDGKTDRHDNSVQHGDSNRDRNHQLDSVLAREYDLRMTHDL